MGGWNQNLTRPASCFPQIVNMRVLRLAAMMRCGSLPCASDLPERRSETPTDSQDDIYGMPKNLRNDDMQRRQTRQSAFCRLHDQYNYWAAPNW
jgi:hypothetical protein